MTRPGSPRGQFASARNDCNSLPSWNQRRPGIFVGIMNVLSKLPRNRLLLALPSRDLRRLMSHLEHVPCRREQILVEADSSLDHVFFPDSGVVSVMAVYSDGGTIEMATIGREGCAVCRPSSAPASPPLGIGFKSRGAQQRYLAPHLH